MLVNVTYKIGMRPGIPRNKTKGKKAKEGKETVPNANYLWINLFVTSLKETGRAALVMANSASDARNSEAKIRQSLIENNLIYSVLTLPSNMFYTVTLPATLWFFDKAKHYDRILFIDSRNIFTQIDRSHRVFSEEQLQNIALISKLYKGNRSAFVILIDRYFAEGIKKLTENEAHIKPISIQLLDVLESMDGKEIVNDLVKLWESLFILQDKYKSYLLENSNEIDVDIKNIAQHSLRAIFDPLFVGFHNELKRLDKILREHEKKHAEDMRSAGKRNVLDRQAKLLKSALESLRKEVKTAESWFNHIKWLQDRFPQAKYEDVTGLCKLASLDEIKEQDYSLNPGRYVGVIIEEDGKTEDEFLIELNDMNNELNRLNAEAHTFEIVIDSNIKQLIGES